MKKPQDLNYWYNVKMTQGPSVEVDESFGQELWGYCKRMVKRYFPNKIKFALYQDCIPDSVSEVLRCMDKFNPDVSVQFTTWVGSIVNHICFHAQDDRMKRNEYPLFDDYDYATSVESSKEERFTLRQLLSKLPEDEQALVRLKLDGYENKEVGEKLGISEDAADSKYRRIVKKLTVLASKKQ